MKIFVNLLCFTVFITLTINENKQASSQCCLNWLQMGFNIKANFKTCSVYHLTCNKPSHYIENLQNFAKQK